MRLDQWGKGRQKDHGNLSRKKKLKKGWEEGKDLERALGDQDMAQRGSFEVLCLGGVLSWMPCRGLGQTLLRLSWAFWASSLAYRKVRPVHCLANEGVWKC